jgi:hypothetical protein
MRRRRALKLFMFITRFIIFSLIIILMAQPFIEIQTSEKGSPKLTILIDNSSSMSVFDLSFADRLTKEIEKQVPIKVRHITSDKSVSDIGEEIIRNMERDANILLISDMQITHGMDFNSAASFSKALNSTISAVKIESDKNDLSVYIEGDNKAIAGQEKEFIIHINKINMKEYNILVSINDEPIYNARDNKDMIKLRHKFESGTYRITAKLLGDDDFPENNIFYKTVSVTPKPKVLYVTRTSSKLPALLSAEPYEIEKVTAIPSDLSEYYAVIIEDMNTLQITNVDELSEFVEEGNGLMVIGGMNSFDRGEYKSSKFEALLPVVIGKGSKKQGDSNIVILIDLSGTTQAITRKDSEGRLVVDNKEGQPLDVIKALAIDVIGTLNRGNRVGIVAFAIPDPSSVGTTSFKAVKITDIQPLFNIREMAIDKISRISTTGQTLFDIGFSGAYSLIKHETGSRNVILISDGGEEVYSKIKENALRIVNTMAAEGIRTYTVGVGRSKDEDFSFLSAVANTGNGIFFPASQKNDLKILFGEPEEKGQGDEMALFIRNPTHFITRDLKLDANVYGFNQVVPKTLARVLVTIDSGEPAISEWRYGLGKVITATVFSGNAGLGQILSGNNSQLITKSLNYLIGNPERKLDYTIDIPDTRINDLARIIVTSKSYPKSEIDLIKTRENVYEGRERVDTTGFNTILNKDFAVNYPIEYERLGMNKDVESTLEYTGGKFFGKEDAERIVEHVKTVSKRPRVQKTPIIWPIIIMIFAIYLFEIACRKIFENKKSI